MKFSRNFSFIMLLVVAVSLTGCDAGQILDTISKVASGVAEAIPKVREVINSVGNAIQSTNNTAENETPANNGNAEQNAPNNAAVRITSAGDDEDIGAGTTGIGQPSGAVSTPSPSTGTTARIASSIRSLIGSTRFRGADVDGGNLACAKVVSTALVNAGVLNRVRLNCDDVVADLRAAGWRSVRVPPYQEGDVVTWTTSRGPGRHIGVIVRQGNSFQAVSNSSSARTPRVHSINYMPITQVLRKV